MWPGDEAQRRGAGLGDVLGVLDADDPEVGLLPGRAEDVAGREELAPVQAAGEVEDARALHHRVVDVEERRGGRGRPECPARVSTSAAAAAASPASVERWRRFGGVRGRSGGAFTRSAYGSADAATSSTCRCVGCPPCRRRTTSPRWSVQPRPSSPTGSHSSRPSGRSLTWAELEDEVGRVATGLGAAGIVAGYRVMIVIGNRIEFVTTYLGVLRAQAVAVPVNPGSHAGRAGPDDRRLRVAAGGRRRRHRRRGPRGACDCSTRRWRASRTGGIPSVLAGPRTPVVVRSACRRLTGELAYDELRVRRRRAESPPLPDPEKLAPALHQRHVRPARARRCSRHRALLANIEQVAAVEPPMMHGDDVVLGVLPLFHVYGLNAVLGGVLRHRAKLVLAERFDPQGTLDLIEDEACSVVPVAPPVFAYWRDDRRPRGAARPGPADPLRLGAAVAPT